MNFFKKPVHKSILGIAIDQNVLTLSLLTGNGNGIRVQKSTRVEMALDIFSAEPELVGQELRNHIQKAGIHETHCVVSIPVQWVISQSLKLPKLSPEDERNYITLHSEKAFPYPAQDLSISISKYTNDQDQACGLISAVAIRQIEKLRAVFQAAKLHPVSLTVGVAHFELDQPHVQLILQRREQGTDCFIVSGNSILSARYLSHAPDEYENDPVYLAGELKRELRITLGQMPAEIRNALQSVHLYGPEPWCTAVETMFPSLPGCAAIHDIQVQTHLQTADPVAHAFGYEHAVSIAAAFYFLKRQRSRVEYLPPRVTRIERLFQQVSSKRNLVIGQVAATVTVILALLFGYQHWTFSRLSSGWAAVEDRVTEVDEIQQKLKQFRPWFHPNIPSLTVLKTLAELFPEEGSIWVKTVQIENETFITLSGFANNNQILSDTMDRLNANEDIEALQLKQVSGTSPIQYSMQFNWIGG